MNTITNNSPIGAFGAPSSFNQGPQIDPLQMIQQMMQMLMSSAGQQTGCQCQGGGCGGQGCAQCGQSAMQSSQLLGF